MAPCDLRVALAEKRLQENLRRPRSRCEVLQEGAVDQPVRVYSHETGSGLADRQDAGFGIQRRDEGARRRKQAFIRPSEAEALRCHIMALS